MTTARYATALTGGAAGSLDAKAVATLADGDITFVATGSVLYVYKFVAAATDAESSPNRIRPDDYATAGVWYLQSVGDQTPIGSILAVPFSSPPNGYLECDGAAVSRSTYATLFAVISTTYGVGDGSTTFNLPDYRGIFMRGWAHGQTTDPDKGTRTNRGDGTTGDNVGTKQLDRLASHSHLVYYLTALRQDGANPVKEVSASGGSSGSVASGDEGGSTETRPINTNVMFCIKY